MKREASLGKSSGEIIPIFKITQRFRAEAEKPGDQRQISQAE